MVFLATSAICVAQDMFEISIIITMATRKSISRSHRDFAQDSTSRPRTARVSKERRTTSRFTCSSKILFDAGVLVQSSGLLVSKILVKPNV